MLSSNWRLELGMYSVRGKTAEYTLCCSLI